jgi:hypothetical protein
MIKRVWYIPVAHDENNENKVEVYMDDCRSSVFPCAEVDFYAPFAW